MLPLPAIDIGIVVAVSDIIAVISVTVGGLGFHVAL
jgi:hypothetical protein